MQPKPRSRIRNQSVLNVGANGLFGKNEVQRQLQAASTKTRPFGTPENADTQERALHQTSDPDESADDGNEDTYIERCVRPFIYEAFAMSSLQNTDWYVLELVSSLTIISTRVLHLFFGTRTRDRLPTPPGYEELLEPDFYGAVDKHPFVVMEAKTPGAAESDCEDDYRKQVYNHQARTKFSFDRTAFYRTMLLQDNVRQWEGRQGDYIERCVRPFIYEAFAMNSLQNTDWYVLELVSSLTIISTRVLHLVFGTRTRDRLSTPPGYEELLSRTFLAQSTNEVDGLWDNQEDFTQAHQLRQD